MKLGPGPGDAGSPTAAGRRKGDEGPLRVPVGRRRAGYSFPELVAMLMIVAVTLPITLVMLTGLSVRSAGDAERTEALRLGQELMEEILSRRFDEMTQPDVNGKWTQPGNFAPEGAEPRRDDVDDYSSSDTWYAWWWCNHGFPALCGDAEWENLGTVTLGSRTFQRWVQVHYVPLNNFQAPYDVGSTTSNIKLIAVRVQGPKHEVSFKCVKAAYQE